MDFTNIISESSFFLVFATKNYAKSVMEKSKPGLDMIEQVDIARKLDKKFIVLWDETMSADEEAAVRDVLKGIDIFFEIKTSMSGRGLSDAVVKIKDAIRNDVWGSWGVGG